jgi:hypothetical protein
VKGRGEVTGRRLSGPRVVAIEAMTTMERFEFGLLRPTAIGDERRPYGGSVGRERPENQRHRNLPFCRATMARDRRGSRGIARDRGGIARDREGTEETVAVDVVPTRVKVRAIERERSSARDVGRA